MKTTKRHFKLFKEEAMRWLDAFSLGDWEIDFEHGNVEQGSCANVTWNLSGRRATMRLALDFTYDGDVITDDDVKRAAFHEVCELLLAGVVGYGELRFSVCKEDIDKEKHSVIVRLQNYMVEQKLL